VSCVTVEDTVTAFCSSLVATKCLTCAEFTSPMIMPLVACNVLYTRGRGQNLEADIEEESQAVNITFIRHLVFVSG